MNAASLATLSALLLSAGCSARAGCSDDFTGSEGTRLEQEVESGSALLGGAGEGPDITFEAALRGLPELWQTDSNVLGGLVRVKLDARYENPPFGGDGRTEMPRLGIDVRPAGEAPGGYRQTEAFPRQSSFEAEHPLFSTCRDESDTFCCAYGDSECALLVAVSIRRIDGAPFPPVVVDWTVAVEANVSSCPLGEARPELAITLEDP